MSMNGISNTYIPNTLSGLDSLNATNITINGVDISTIYVPFTGSLNPVDLGGQRIQTSYVPLTGNDLTNQTYVDTQDALRVPYTGASSNIDLGGQRIQTSYVPTTGNDLTNQTYVDTQDALRIPYTGASSNIDIGNKYIRSTFNAVDGTDLVNLSTLQNSYVPYSGSFQGLNMGSNGIFTNATPAFGNSVLNLNYSNANLVSFSGSLYNLDMGSKRIQTTYVPLASNDVLNKTYGDTTYASVGGTNTFSSTNTFNGTTNLGTTTFSTLPSTGSVVYYLAIDSGNTIIRTASSLNQTASTSSSVSYIPFVASATSGSFLPLTNTSISFVASTGQLSTTGINTTGSSSIAGYVSNSTLASYGYATLASPTFTGTIVLPNVTFTSTPPSGPATYFLAVNSTNQIVSTSSAVNQTASSSSSTCYITFVASSASGAFLPLTNTSISYVPSTGQFTTTGINTTGSSSIAGYATTANPTFTGNVTLPANTTSFSAVPTNVSGLTNILAVTAGGLIQTTTITTGSSLQVLASTISTIYLAGNTINTNGVAFVPTLTNGCYITTDVTGAVTSLIIPNVTIASAGSGTITASSFVGTLTGNVSGNVTGNVSGNVSGTTLTASSGVSTPLLYFSGGDMTLKVNTAGQKFVFENPTGYGFLKFYSLMPANAITMIDAGTYALGINSGSFTLSLNSTNYFTLDTTKASYSVPVTIQNQLNSSTSTLELNAYSGAINLKVANTIYATIDSNGLSTNTINGFTSNGLTLNGKNATGTTAFKNNGNTHLTIGSTLISSVYYPFFNISTYYDFRISNTSYMSLGSNGMSLNGTASILYVDKVSSNNALQLNATTGNNINLSINSSNIAIVTSSGLYVNGTTSVCNGNYFQGGDSNSQMVMPYSTEKNIFIQNTNTLYGSAIAASGNWNSGNYTVFTNSTSRSGTTAGLGVWGGVGGAGICSLSPQVSWQGLFLIGGPIYAYNTSVLGSTLTSTGWVNSSDRRFKKNIRPIKTTRSLERVLAVRPVTYNMIYDETQCPVSDTLKNQQCLGFIAQEIAETNPHCIHEVDDATSKEKRFALQYNDYVVHLCGSVQEQQKQIEQQHKKIEEQSITINQLTLSLSQLTEHVAILTTAFNDLKKK